MELLAVAVAALVVLGAPGLASIYWLRSRDASADAVELTAVGYGGLAVSALALWLSSQVFGASWRVVLCASLAGSAAVIAPALVRAALRAAGSDALGAADALTFTGQHDGRVVPEAFVDPGSAALNAEIPTNKRHFAILTAAGTTFAALAYLPFLSYGLGRADGVHRMAMTDWYKHLMTTTALGAADSFPPPNPFLHAADSAPYYYGFHLVGASIGRLAAVLTDPRAGDLAYASLLLLTLLTAFATPFVAYTVARTITTGRGDGLGDATRVRCLRDASLPSGEFRSFEALVEEFLGPEKVRIRSCAVGVAGPVVAGRSHVVNLRWPVDERRLARSLGTRAVRVINDLEANAWGIAAVPARKMANLTPRLRPTEGNAALIAAGTGLGMALMLWDGERWHPRASEGGHQAFAPRDELEVDLLRFMWRRHGRVSVERIVSGPGLSAIYEFLIASGRGRKTRRMARRLAQADDPNAVVAEAGLAADDATAGRALERLVSLYGAAAGDLALVARATAGVYVGGGIAPRILPAMRAGGFLRAFRDKGRLTPLVERIPVKVLLEPRAALLGAARCAATLRGSCTSDRRR